MSASARPLEIAPHVVVIGAGAAGLMAAAEAASRGARVDLLEKNGKTGVKILMSGGTRCNLTQDTDARGIAAAFGPGGRFLQKSVGAFCPDQVVALFQSLGVTTKVESTGKIFPRSDRAVDVRDALQRRAETSGVRVHLRAEVRGLVRRPGGWTVATTSGPLDCDRVIVTSGGRSWPRCGTTGDAYQWLAELGHRIVPTRPALVPLVGGHDWTHDLSGLTLPDCLAEVYRREDWEHQPAKKRKALASRRSSWLFTHFGFSGPAAMDVSGAITAQPQFNAVTLIVDLVPGLSADEVQTALSRRQRQGRKSVAAVVGEWLPGRLAETIVRVQSADTTLAQLSRSASQSLVQALKAARFPVHGTRGFGKAEVTAGGVTLSEVDPRTMRSRLAEGLFIAGEVLDVDGPIGGYNFQAAFSTGRAAGIAAAATAP